jgi:hypothetical protein
VAPGINALITTMKNTTSKIDTAPGAPASTGKVARMIGTAPRSPTHPM